MREAALSVVANVSAQFENVSNPRALSPLLRFHSAAPREAGQLMRSAATFGSHPAYLRVNPGAGRPSTSWERSSTGSRNGRAVPPRPIGRMAAAGNPVRSAAWAKVIR